MSVTRLGVSVEKVVATMDMPSSHQGMARPDRKNSEVLRPDRLATKTPISSANTKKATTNIQSSEVSCMNAVARYLPCVSVMGTL
ncbi:MAG: hypothetical protein ACYS7M_16030 [Planctomycetota bacterium]|jgi:hypothetical protein